jgi:tetratricopeptide (TPR) repeat protein
LGLYLAVVWLVPSILPDVRRWRRIAGLPGAAVVVALAVVAHVQTGYWRDGVTLMRRALDVTQDNAFARASLADALFNKVQVDESIEQFRAAIRLAPSDAAGYYRLGYLFENLRRYPEAAQEYRRALALDDRNATTHVALASVLSAQGQRDEAKHEFGRALELDPNNAEAWIQLAALARERRDRSASNAYAERALAINPRLQVCARIIAQNLHDTGQLDAAVARLESIAEPSRDERTRELLRRLQGERNRAGRSLKGPQN